MNTNKQIKTEHSLQNFDSLKYSLLDNNGDIFLDSSCDPDLNLISKNIKNLDTRYLFLGKLHNFHHNSVTNWFSILRLHFRSINKNFENFKLFLSLEFFFSVICFSETWLGDF